MLCLCYLQVDVMFLYTGGEKKMKNGGRMDLQIYIYIICNKAIFF